MKENVNKKATKIDRKLEKLIESAESKKEKKRLERLRKKLHEKILWTEHDKRSVKERIESDFRWVWRIREIKDKVLQKNCPNIKETLPWAKVFCIDVNRNKLQKERVLSRSIAPHFASLNYWTFDKPKNWKWWKSFNQLETAFRKEYGIMARDKDAKKFTRDYLAFENDEWNYEWYVDWKKSDKIYVIVQNDRVVWHLNYWNENFEWIGSVWACKLRIISPELRWKVWLESDLYSLAFADNKKIDWIVESCNTIESYYATLKAVNNLKKQWEDLSMFFAWERVDWDWWNLTDEQKKAIELYKNWFYKTDYDEWETDYAKSFSATNDEERLWYIRHEGWIPNSTVEELERVKNKETVAYKVFEKFTKRYEENKWEWRDFTDDDVLYWLLVVRRNQSKNK